MSELPSARVSPIGLLTVGVAGGLIGGFTAGFLLLSQLPESAPAPAPAPALTPTPSVDPIPAPPPAVPRPEAPEAPDTAVPPKPLSAEPLADGPPFAPLDTPLDSQSEFIAKTRVDAAAGNVDAMCRLADYMAKDGYGVTQNIAGANDWLRRARAVYSGAPNYGWSNMTLQHANLLARPPDRRMANPAAALVLYRDVLERCTDADARMRARIALAGMHAEGLGVPLDLKRSYELTEEAAEAAMAQGKQGSAAELAAESLAAKLERGEGCEASPAGALVWYRRSIDFDSNPMESDFQPLLRLLEGNPDLRVEPAWFAAHTKSATMAYLCGRFYEEGLHGFPKDDARALAHYREAVALEHVFAESRVTAILERRPDLVSAEKE